MLKKYHVIENLWLLFWAFPFLVVACSAIFSGYIWVLEGFPIPYSPRGLDAGEGQWGWAIGLLCLGLIPKWVRIAP